MRDRNASRWFQSGIPEATVTAHALASITDGAVWGTSFPVSPSNGDIFYRADLLEMFQYISSESAWFGRELETTFGKGGTGFNDEYLRHGDSIGAASRGKYMPYDVMITGMTGSWDTALTSGDFRVRRGGSNVWTADWGTWGDTSTTIDKTLASGSGSSDWIDFAAAGKMQVYLDTLSAAINQPHVTVYYRRKET